MLSQSEGTGAPTGEAGTFISRKKYAAILGICPRSAVRRENRDPDFPPVFFINGRAYVTEAALAAYQAILMRRGLSEGPANPRGRRPRKTAPGALEAV